MLFKPRMVLLCYIGLPALTSAGLLINMPNDGQNAFLFGLSKSRLIVALALFLAVLVFVGLTAYTVKHTDKSVEWLKRNLEHRNFIALSSGLIFILAMTVLCIPDKYLGELLAIQNRLRPFETWIFLTSLQALIGIIGLLLANQKKEIFPSKSSVITMLIVIGIILLVWLFISLTGLGLTGTNSYWSKIGVPILWPQILLAIGIGLGLKLITDRIEIPQFSKKWLDLLLMILIWLSAVILWNHQSYIQGVFNTQPRPPTYEIFPINDSQVFDVDAQNLLIGQKIAEIDKPLYISFLAVLHFLAGTSYSQFYLYQIMIFGLIPVLGFLIGKNLHSRPLGLAFSIALLFKELNAIALTNYIQVSTSKMILSEMLTTLGVLLFTFFMLRWFKSLELFDPNLMIASGILGVTSLVRLNAIGILPVVILIIGMAVNFKWKKWIAASMLICAFVLIGLAPWMVRNTIVTGSPVSFINSKTEGVIGNERYTPLINNNQSTQAPFSNQSKYLVIGKGVVTNYLHNLIGITLMVPPSFELYNQVDLVRLPYWKLDWSGTLLPDGFWIILGTLGIISMGIASAWRRWRFAGLLPLGVVLGYNITTAFALTSGGRYLVPMDWGALFYFSIGLLDVFTWILILFGWIRKNGLEDLPQQKSAKIQGSNQILLTGLIFLFLGAIPVFMENYPHKSYPPSVTMTDFVVANRSNLEFSAPGNENNLSLLLNNPDAVVYYGKALYPRYFGENKGEGLTVDQDPLIGSIGFDRLSFLLIGGKSSVPVLSPINNSVSAIAQGADTWVIGCKRTNYIEAIYVVFRQNGNENGYWQDPIKSNCR